jgi:lysozyme
MLNLYKYLKYIGMKNPNAHLRMSGEGKRLLIHFEDVRLKAYADSAGVITIGIGATHYGEGTKVRKGDTITMEQAYDLLDLLLPQYEAIVRKKVTRPLLQHEFDALVDFTNNTGGGYNNDDKFHWYDLWENVNKNMGKDGMYAYWTKTAVTAGGKLLAGLARRRKSEVTLYNTGVVNFYQ